MLGPLPGHITLGSSQKDSRPDANSHVVRIVKERAQLARCSVIGIGHARPQYPHVSINCFVRHVVYTGFNTSTNVQLRFTIQGSGFKLTTRTTYMPPIITLQAGIQEILYGTDLSTYFDPSNLDFTGISKTEYLRTNLLPEGYYTFTVEVFNYPRGNPVSKATASAYIVLNDPPIINTPGNNSKPLANDPQNIVFSWTPMHMGSPNSAFTTEYELKIVEIWPKGRDPYEAMRTSPAFYQTTTQNTQLVYDMMCPLLTPGNDYAFNIRAKAIVGIDQLDLFKNDGYSETFKFTFGDECKPPTGFEAKPVNGGGLEVTWKTGMSQTGYNIRYRVKGSDKDWWSDQSMTDNIRIYQLPSNTDIEYKVNSECSTILSAYSDTQYAHTATVEQKPFVCKDATPPATITNFNDMPTLVAGANINAGGFNARITQVTRNSDGSFSGECIVTIPFFNYAKVAHTFDHIKVNELGQLYQGKLVSKEDTTGAFMTKIDMNKSNQQNQETTDTTTNTLASDTGTVKIEGKIDSVYIQGDKVIVVSDNGNKTDTIEQKEGEKKLITDEKGNQYLAANGTVTKIGGEEIEGGAPEEILMSTMADKAKSLKLVINNDDYKNGDSYYTIYNNKDIEIKLENTDTTFKLDMSKIKWKLAGTFIASKDKMPDVFAFNINTINLPKFTNELVVTDSLGKGIIKLKIRTYYAPIVRFEEGSDFNGEYFFDHGYEFTALASPTYYDTIQVGKNKETYYAPVMGLNKDQSATVKVKIDGFTNNVLQDKDFKIAFKPELAGKITINGLDSLVLDANGLDNLNDIIIKAVDFINGDALTAMPIKVYISSTREKVGLLKYYCAQKVIKTVTLIYTKFKDESSFPTYLTPSSLSQFLNNNSLNQFFLDVTVDSIHFTSKRFKVAIMNSWGNSQIIDSLNSEKFGIKHGATPTGYSSKDDYFYITNLERPGSTPDSHIGGFHWPGSPGGVQVKYIATQYNESAEELTAHELGHWLGLPHTFEKNTHVLVIVEPVQGGTKDNFMDYDVKRKKWLKIQLLNYSR